MDVLGSPSLQTVRDGEPQSPYRLLGTGTVSEPQKLCTTVRDGEPRAPRP